MVPLTKGYFAIIDEGDSEQVCKTHWHVNAPSGRRLRYAQTNQPDGTIALHRFLWALWHLPPSPEIDHKNGNGLDCRRTNLRAATTSENQANKGPMATNTSGLKGVCWSARDGKWIATIGVRGKKICLGYFDGAEEAAAAYAAAAAQHFGAYARTEAFVQY